VVERKPPVVPREPGLREAQRQEEQCAGEEAEPPAHEEDERDEPDQVLRRQHLVERDERRDCRGSGEQHGLSVAVAAPGEDDPDRDDGHHSEHRREIRGEACPVSAKRLRSVRIDGCERTHPEVLGRHQDGGAEALHLQRPAELVGEHRAQAVRRDDREGQEARGRDGDERGQVGERSCASLSPPEVDERDREEDHRPELRGEAEPE